MLWISATLKKKKFPLASMYDFSELQFITLDHSNQTAQNIPFKFLCHCKWTILAEHCYIPKVKNHFF